MRILYIQARYHSNQHYAMKSLVDQGHDVRYLVWGVGPSENYTVLQPRQIPYSRVYLLLERLVRGANKETMQSLYGFPSFVRMYREVRRFDPDVVVLRRRARASLGVWTRFASLAAMMQGTPRVFWDHKPLTHKRSLKWQLRHPGRSLRVRRDVSFTTLTGVFSPGKPVKSRKTYVIPLVVESAGARPKAVTSHAGPVRILGLGKYSQPRKNHALLLAAVAKVAASHDIALTLVGSGDPNDGHVTHLRRLACELGIEDKARLVFNITHAEMPDVYAQHDLFVLPSSKEPFGYSVLEAMAAGLPVIVSDTCGSREYFDEGVNGNVFASDDPDSLAAAIVSVVGDRGAMREMGEKSIRIAKERYAPRVYHDRLMDLLWNEFGLGRESQEAAT